MSAPRSLIAVAAAISSGALSPVQAVEDCLDRIEAANPVLNAFLTVAGEAALAAARRAQEALGAGVRLPLLGVPVAVKDLEDTADMVTTYGCARYSAHRPAQDSVVVERLRAAGAVIVGKTNTPALALLGETYNDLRENCRNPRDLRLTSGGSSGGSAAAVAAGLVCAATGTDYGGSVPAPAAFCGIVGFKPTHGLIPIVPRPVGAMLFEAIGLLVTTVADAGLLLEVLAGPDLRDPVSLTVPTVSAVSRVDVGPGGRARRIRVAWSADLGRYPVDPQVADVAGRAVARLEALGWDVRARAPAFDDPWQVFAPLSATELRLLVEQALGGQVDELDPQTREELAAVPELSAQDYVRAYHRMLLFRAQVARFFAEVDLVATPTTAVAAFPVRQPPASIGGRPVTAGWPSFMPFQVPWNLAGSPVITLPAGTTADGRPVGLQLAAPPGADRALLQAAAAAEHLLASSRPS